MRSLVLALTLLLGPSVPNRLPGVDLKRELCGIKDESRIIRDVAEPKTVALTFDDGPHPGRTDQLLNLLYHLKVKATFFVVGKMVDRSPELVRAEYRLGHEVANHSYNHPNLELLSEAQIQWEYAQCSRAIYRAIGVSPKFCRPPGGRFDQDVIDAANDEGMRTVVWNCDPGDFARPDAKTLEERIDRQLKNGGIILLHDGIPQTIQILPDLVDALRKKGYRFVTCSEILAEQTRLALARKTPPVAKRR